LAIEDAVMDDLLRAAAVVWDGRRLSGGAETGPGAGGVAVTLSWFGGRTN